MNRIWIGRKVNEMKYVKRKMRDMKPEHDADIITGYVVMVEDDGTWFPYSKSIHPSYSNAVEEVETAEYHGWNAHIKSVEFVLKGGEWKNG